MLLVMKKYVVVILLTLCILLIPKDVVLAAETSTGEEFVIVLDPGHDAIHAGAQNGDLGEEDLVYKIAQYCKEELDKYNVTVYMTRCGYECENGGRAITSTQCNAKRVEFAASVGADIYVSFHLNSNNSASPHGLGIFYPNSNYRPDLGEEGHGLANVIFEKLTALGLAQWSDGVMIRNSQDNTLYPDGSLADYYGIIRRNKEAGIPAVLIEHAFISNPSDVEKFLSSDEKLKSLGATDASAIIEYYQLSNTSEDENEDIVATGVVNIENINTVSGVFDVIVSDIEIGGRVAQVQVPIWSKADASDMVWYNATKQADGTYRVHVDVKNHDCNFGTYNVHTYVRTNNGNMYAIDGRTVNIPMPSTEINVSLNSESSIMSLDAWHVPGTFGQSLESVSFAVWSEANGGDDLVWYQGVPAGDRFVVDVSLDAHKSTGKYSVHVYANYANGTSRCVAATTVDVDNALAGDVQIVNANNVIGSFDVIVSNVSVTGGVNQVMVPIWSKEDQSDIVWYEAKLQDDGTYKVHVDVANHNCNFSKYLVHTYVRNGYGELIPLDARTVNMTTPGAVVSVAPSEDYTELKIEAWHVPGVFGESLNSVSFAVWNDVDGSSDLKWYTAERVGDKYVANVSIEEHGNAGAYNVHTYASYKNGSNQCLSGETLSIKDISVESVEIMNVNKVAGTFDVVVSNVTAIGGVEKVEIPVWSDTDPSDIIWYAAEKQADGSYKVHVDVANHGCKFTNYQVHTYVRTGKGQLINVDADAVDLTTPGTVISASMSESYSKLMIEASQVPGTSGQSLNGVSFAVWSQNNGQDDLQWYTGALIGDKFVVDVPLENHKDVGVYYIHVYASKVNGVNEFLGEKSFDRPLTSIMGISYISVEQLKGYYLEHATFPSYYEGTDANTLDMFCQMYIEECNAEGVKVEVAFCQAMLETGFLTFGGDVDITQHNFAGIGATGGGNPGCSFATVREGIRAQVQHLKAYASSDVLTQGCVDPRFAYVTRETAPYVEWLGIQENPYGVGWAASDDYGYILRDSYIFDLCN